MNPNQKIIRDLEKNLIHHKALYYSGKPIISDVEFDALEDSLKKIDPNNSTLKIVGSISEGLDKVKHNSKMLSLSKTYKLDELNAWKGDRAVVSMYKIDGVSCSIIYENGFFSLAKTRGDGFSGENISLKARWMSSIPKEIENFNCEIRGEIFCTEEAFFLLSEEMEAKGLERPSSQRNIVAGLISRKENLELCRYIEFKAFDIIMQDGDFLKTEMDKYHFLKKQNFETLDVQLHNEEATIEKVITESKEFMANGNYQIDGLVFAYNDLELHRELGETAHHPRYKMAFKFAGESKNTKICEINWSVSRNGILTPVATVEETQLSGANILRVTLHNYGMVKLNNLKIGDEIKIIRSGEVIPKFVEVVARSKDHDFCVPKICPSCEEKIIIKDIRLICINPLCPAVVKEGIMNFIQKIGIDDLSIKRLEAMINLKMVASISDLYRLTIEDLLKLEKVKEKLATKLILNIEGSKQTDLITFLASLGISGGAYNKCEKVIFAGYNTIEKLKNLSIEKLEEIDSFANKSATDFYDSLTNLYPLIDELVLLGFEFYKEEAKETLLTNKKICITGSLSTTRTNVETKVRSLGGIITASVTKKTDYLLTNDTEAKSSKYKKALDLEVEIINESFLDTV